MKVEDWVTNRRHEYDLRIDIREDGNQFVKRSWIISDPKGQGVSVTLSENEEGNASL